MKRAPSRPATSDAVHPEQFGADPAPAQPPSPLEGALCLPPEVLDQFERYADDWVAEPQSLVPHLSRRLLIHLQILDHITTHPPEGRTGIAVALTAHKEFRMVADLLIEAFAAVDRKREILAQDAASRAPTSS